MNQCDKKEICKNLKQIEKVDEMDSNVIEQENNLCIVCLEFEGILNLCVRCKLKYCSQCANKLSNKCCICLRNSKNDNINTVEYFDNVEFELSYSTPCFMTVFISYTVSLILHLFSGIFFIFVFIFFIKIILNLFPCYFLKYWIMN